MTFARKGDSLPGSPWQLAGNIDYTAGLSEGTKGYLHADVRYNSHNRGKLASYDDPGASGYDPNLRFDPAVTEANARIGIRTGRIDASLFVHNIFDAAPLLGKSHDTETSPLFYYRTVRPRMVGLTIAYRH